jgi:iron(III) transport system permease protein
MGRTVRTETIVLALCIAVIAIAGLAPIAVMAVESVRHNGQLSLDHYRELISAARFWPLLGNSIRLALATTAVCGFVGVPAGILFAKSDLPLRSGFMWLLTVPLVLPPYFVALGWARVVARIGIVTSDWLFGFGGCVLVLSSVFLPITILLTFASILSVDRRLEEAARIVSGWPGVLRRVTLPLSAPAIAFSLVLAFLLAMGELSVPSFLRYPVLPVLSFTQFAASYNFGAAAAAAVPLAAIAFVGVLVESAFLRDRDYAFRSTGQNSVHFAAGLEESFPSHHRRALFCIRHSSVERAIRRRIFASRDSRSTPTRRSQRCEKRSLLCGRRYHPNESRILPGIFHA